MDVKKCVKLVLRSFMTVGLIAVYIYSAHILQYWNNITGAAPLVLLTGITAFLTALIWKHHKNAETSTIVFAIMSVIWALLFIPALTGNWYPLAKMPMLEGSAPDLAIYAPFEEDTWAAKLPVAASFYSSC